MLKVHQVISSALLAPRKGSANDEEAHRLISLAFEEADRVLCALDAAGYAVVPKVPSFEMTTLAAAEVFGFSAIDDSEGTTTHCNDVYAAMLAAAPPFVDVNKKAGG